MAEGTWEKFWTHGRGKAPLVGRGEEEGRTAIGKLPAPACACPWAQCGAALQRLWGSKKALAHLGEIRRFLCRLPVARHLSCGLRA